MAVRAFLQDFIIATPPSGNHHVTAALRPSLLSTLFEDIRPMVLSGMASLFVASVALLRLEQTWAFVWMLAEVALVGGRFGIARAYLAQRDAGEDQPERWAMRYAPVSLAACFLLGLGTMGCVDSVDVELGTLSVMVAGGVFGGIASRNAALPRLAMMQIALGVLPIGVGALLSPRHGASILLPPLAIYLAAMRTVVQRHYKVLVALIAARQCNAELVARFDAALTHMPHGLCMIDGESRVIVTNRRTSLLFGSPREIALNTPFPDVVAGLAAGCAAEPGPAEIGARCRAWLGREPAPLDLTLTDGRQLEMTRHQVPDGSAVIIVEDVTVRRRAEQDIRHLARHDPLTGLPNRHELHAELTRLLARRPNRRGTAVAVMYLDLDGFKSINDRFGHHAGDEVLTQVAARLARTLLHGELATRVGGDEFVVVIPESSAHACAILAAMIIRQIAAPYALSIGETVTLGISIGIALAGEGETPDDLLRQADNALYEAKSGGKGVFRFYSNDRKNGTRVAAGAR
ncbi:Diguanylate cyclase [Burkholderia multivorans]